MSYCRSLVVFSPPIPLLSVRYGRFLSAERILNVTLFNWGDVVKMSSMVAAFWRRLQCYSLLEPNRRPVADDTFDLPRRKFPALCVLGKNERFSFFHDSHESLFFRKRFFFFGSGPVGISFNVGDWKIWRKPHQMCHVFMLRPSSSNMNDGIVHSNCVVASVV